MMSIEINEDIVCDNDTPDPPIDYTQYSSQELPWWRTIAYIAIRYKLLYDMHGHVPGWRYPEGWLDQAWTNHGLELMENLLKFETQIKELPAADYLPVHFLMDLWQLNEQETVRVAEHLVYREVLVRRFEIIVGDNDLVHVDDEHVLDCKNEGTLYHPDTGMELPWQDLLTYYSRA